MTDYFKMFNSPYFSIGSFLFFQQLGRVLNLESYVTQLRILYLTAQISIVALSFFLVHKIKQKNGKYFLCILVALEGRKKRKEGTLNVNGIDQTVLKYVEPAAQNWDGTETGDQLVNTTVMGKV